MLATLLEKTPIITGFNSINAAMMAEYRGAVIKPEVNKRFSLITLVLNLAHSPTPRIAACFLPRILLKNR